MALGYKDLIDHARDFGGAPIQRANSRLLYQAVQSAVRMVVHARPWNFLRRLGRITLDATYSSGTVTYDHTGGTYERMVTLTGGTWPSWAADGMIEIDSTHYLVEDRKSDTIITLRADHNPGADIATATSYNLDHVIYQLPDDLLTSGKLFINRIWPELEIVPLSEWLRLFHLGGVRAGQPYFVAVGQDPDHPGRYAFFISPSALNSQSIEFFYQADLRTLRVSGENNADKQGTVTISGTTVAGTGTNFKSYHKGCLLRLGWDAARPATGWNGDNPPHDEVVVKGVDSPTQLTLVSAPTGTYSGASYYLTDPVDVPKPFENAIYRAIELQLSQAYDLGRDLGALYTAYNKAFMQAAENDRMFWGEQVGTMHGNWQPVLLTNV